MNQSQQTFYDFVMERVQENKAAELETVLNENFRRHDNGTVTREYMEESGPKLVELLKPQYQTEFSKLMESYFDEKN